LTIGPGSIAGNGKLDSQSIAVTLRGRQLPVELGARLAGYREVVGRLGIDLDLQGSLTAPRGRLIVTGDALHFAAASRPDLPPLTLSARGDWQSGRVDFRGRVDAPHNAAIGFFGSAPFELRPGPAVVVPPNGRLAVKLEGAGELAQFNDLLPLGEDRVSGHYTLDASVEGTVAAPKAGGSLVVSRARFEDLTSGLTLTAIDFRLDGNEQRFVMSKFSASDGGEGKITAKGGIDLVATPGPAIDLQIVLQHLHAVRRDDADITAGGTVNIGGTITALQVEADVTVENGELRIPDKLTASSPNLQVVRVNSRTGVTAPAQSKPAANAEPILPAKLAIKLSAPGRVFVRGHGLDAEWRGDLTINGTTATPIITGSLSVVRGTFSLLGKDFILTRGTISFAGGTGADPVLDLVAEASSTGITVQAIISGTVSSPSIRLTSTPVMPQDEVLSRLLFGTTVGQITPIQGLQLAQAAAQLAGGGGPDILGTIRRNLGLDRLAVGSSGGASGALPGGPLSTSGSGTSSQSGISNTQVSAGKYIVPGFYVGVAQGVGAGQSAVRVEGEVTPNITIDAQAGGQAKESIGLNFKLDY
jgi:translocation and assembly module TamB